MGNAGRVLMIPKGDYNPATPYEMLDCVYYNGRSYVCKQASTGHAPTDIMYWQPMTPDSSAEIQALTNEVRGNWDSGGVNLYVGSPSFDGYNARSNWTKQTETYNGHAVYKRSEAWGGAYALIPLTEGTYTFSVAVKTSDGGNVALFGILNNISTATIEPAQSIHVATSTSWTRKSLTFTVTQAGTVALRIEKEGSGDIYVSEYQLENGSTATDYQPYAKTNAELTADDAIVDISDSFYSSLQSGITLYDVNMHKQGKHVFGNFVAKTDSVFGSTSTQILTLRHHPIKNINSYLATSKAQWGAQTLSLGYFYAESTGGLSVLSYAQDDNFVKICLDYVTS